MKIVAIEDIAVDGGWHDWSFLKITTDSGIVGWSEFNQERGRRGLGAVIRDMRPLLIGEDPRDVGRIAARLYNLVQSTAGGLQSLAIGAYENALLDIKAKALGVPVYELFGGALRTRLPLYWSHCGMYRSRNIDLYETLIDKPVVRDLDGIRDLGREVAAEGYGALKTNLILFEKGKPARIGRGVGPLELNVTGAIVDNVVALLSAFRDGAGPDVRLMMDLNLNYKTEGFRQIAQAVEPLNMMWLEMDSLDPVGLADIRRSTRTPVAGLETVLGRRALQPYLDARSVDIPIVDAVYNGLLESYKMAAQLDAYDLNVAPHNSHGPLGTLISAHFAAVIPNFRILEFDADEVPWRREVLTVPWVVERGEMLLPTGPGWGAEIDEGVARAHPVKHGGTA